MSKIYILLRLYILLKIPFRKITVTFQIPLDPSPISLPLGEPYPFPAFALKSLCSIYKHYSFSIKGSTIHLTDNRETFIQKSFNLYHQVYADVIHNLFT